MPLVVPGIQSKDGKGEDWTTKLMGKSLGDAHNETVSQHHTALEGASCTTACPIYPIPCACRTCTVRHCADKGQTFAKQDLPKEHRVLQPGSMSTMDHRPERLNIHVGEDGTVQKVNHG
jgi:hypothetical protein